MSELFDMLSDLTDDFEDDSRDNVILRAPFGYPGGKDKSVVEIINKLPYRDTFVDVCGGSGIITLNRKKSKVLDVYNDRWSGVTCFFRMLRTNHDELRDSINMAMHSREEFVYAKTHYEDIQLSDLERATLFYVMISHSFGKLGRNWARSLNSKVTFKRNYDVEYWRELHTRFSEVQIENLDWKNVLKDYDGPNTVFYIDPPYPYTDQSIYKHKFKNEDHIKLLDYVHHNVQGYVAVSSYKNDLYSKYPWDDIHVWPVKITIDSKSSTDSGHREYKGQSAREMFEILYIKESK